MNLCFSRTSHVIICHIKECIVVMFQYEKHLIVKCFSSALCHFIICTNSTFCAKFGFLCKLKLFVQILLFMQIPLFMQILFSKKITGFYADRLSIHLGFGPKTHQPSGFEGRDKPGAQLVGFSPATTRNILKIGKNT